jgi:hypothetical protein
LRKSKAVDRTGEHESGAFHALDVRMKPRHDFRNRLVAAMYRVDRDAVHGRQCRERGILGQPGVHARILEARKRLVWQ